MAAAVRLCRFSRGKFLVIKILAIFVPIEVSQPYLILIGFLGILNFRFKTNQELRFNSLDLVGLQLSNLTRLLLVLLVASFFSPGRKKLYFGIITSIGLFLLIRFRSANILSFYIFFERAVLPVFLLILGWGYQPERLRASLYILFYTLVASLPLLISIILIMNNYSSNFSIIPIIDRSFSNSLILLVLIAAFLVKFPIYGVHY